MLTLRIAFCFCIALAGAAPVHALAQKLPVHVRATVSQGDNVGERFVFEIKEIVRGSHAFRYVEKETFPRLTLSIVTQKDGTHATMAAVSFLYDDIDVPMHGIFLTQYIQNCGSDAVNQCARGIVAALDGQVVRLREEEPKLHKKLK